MEDRYVILCSCGHQDHQIIVWQNKEDEEYILSFRKTPQKFFRRIVYFFKFIFGLEKSLYDDVILRYEDVKVVLEDMKHKGMLPE